MPQVRLALAQINPTVGDLQGNRDKILAYCSKASEQKADLVLFPEMVLSGYPIEDLALSKDFLIQSEKTLLEIAKLLKSSGLGRLKVVIGHPALAASPSSWAIGQNRASLIFDGELVFSYAKHHLPNYSVFDEYRIFTPGNQLVPFEVAGLRFAAVICEDIWQSGGPVAELGKQNVDVALVLNGSPFEMTKLDSRAKLVKNLAKQQGCAVAYVNLVGGQDDLVFDGNSFAVDSNGVEKLRMAQFAEELGIIDIASRSSICGMPNHAATETVEQLWQAIVMGTRDYVRKNGFSKVVLGLSGGIDSAVCATIAADAIGAENVYTIAMPSKYSSDHSLSDAGELAKNLGTRHRVEPISEMVGGFVKQLELSGLAEENIQARVRALILMAESNSAGQLVITTSNKTELAVGYSTIYGDSVGGFAPLRDVEKTLVWQLANYRNDLARSAGKTPPIPQSSISKPPSAELRPDQLDQDSLPEYQLLDDILRGFIEDRKSQAELIEQGFDKATVERVLAMVASAEWKRRQGPIGPRVTKLAFGRERRFPISNAYSKKQG